MDVAPLKQLTLPPLEAAGFLFPRSNGRGPIEAAHAVGGCARESPSFHVRMDVAPLKLVVRDIDKREIERFHVRMDVAPLKHPIRLLQRFPDLCFHVRMDVAPLKRRSRS